MLKISDKGTYGKAFLRPSNMTADFGKIKYGGEMKLNASVNIRNQKNTKRRANDSRSR